MSERILAIESASERCSVALLNEGEVTVLSNDTPRGHADNILPMIDAVLAEQSVKLSTLDAVAFTKGPGAFTSVRIGTAVVQGLALGADLKVIQASSLEVMAQGLIDKYNAKHIMVALDARMDEVYFGLYKQGQDGLAQAIQPDLVSKPEDIEIGSESELINFDWHITGKGFKEYEQGMSARFRQFNTVSEDHDFPSAVALVTVAKQKLLKQDWLDAEQVIPVYIRDQVVK